MICYIEDNKDPNDFVKELIRKLEDPNIVVRILPDKLSPKPQWEIMKINVNFL